MITYENTESEIYEKLFTYESEKYENPNVSKKILQHEIHSPTKRSMMSSTVVGPSRPSSTGIPKHSSAAY